MKISKSAASIGSLFGRLPAVVASTMVALAAFAPAANAVVVTSPAANLTILNNNIGIYVNVVSGANGVTPAAAPGWDLNPYGTNLLNFFISGTTTGSAVVSSVNSGAGTLTDGTVVGPASTYSAATITNTTFGALAGQWAFNSTNYFGFRFTGDDGLVHYGYGTMLIGATAATKSIGSLFYESVAGASITVSAVPEASTTAMMLLGGAMVAGLGLRRRQAAAA